MFACIRIELVSIRWNIFSLLFSLHGFLWFSWKHRMKHIKWKRKWLRNHGSPQWHDIVHFEYKLSWLCFWFFLNASYHGDNITWRTMIFPLTSQCGTPPNNPPLEQVHHRVSSKAYRALEQPPLHWGSIPFSGALEQITHIVWHLSHFWLHLWGSLLLCSTFEHSIDMNKLRIDIVRFERKLSLLYFWFSQKASYQRR